MKQLIEALQIFLKYDNPDNPTYCDHDLLSICGDYDPEKMDPADVVKLSKLGFSWDEHEEYFYSLKYGSA